jgi:hypothetical protein
LRIGVGAQDQCDIAIELYDGAERVGNMAVHLPR